MNKFGEYVTSTAFSLSLSRNMVMMLASMKYSAYQKHMFDKTGNRFSRIESLVRRGLVTEHTRPRVLTTAGELVLQLCDEAGLLDRTLMHDLHEDILEQQEEQQQELAAVLGL